MMMEIKCAILDDEPFARKGIASYIAKIDFLKLVVECEDAIELSQYLRLHPLDLIFLDIEMPEISGLDYIASLSNPPKIIVVSAYEKYALRGYELEVVDYLLKPVPFERFFKAANRAFDVLCNTAPSAGVLANPQEAHIFLKVDKQLKKIFIQDILFVQSMGNYVVVHTSGTREVTYCSLQQMISMLPAQHFIACHRSYLVNKSKIAIIEGNQLHVGEYKIPIARNLRDDVMAAILNITGRHPPR
ncbi:two-component system LytT family response regulator [Sphingobacterium zeae]|uniref:Two-component system LytT family response regulator n=1 Tax=Sphingobacterium zeae TaxID=1776859 RepID=A0ABU0UAE3_9SPHI|nr:LytTR family DNA-binding domain-containing protein [Sphingobacterium zeae]MDQ1151817.1 two-component system LytT family response regulator [Sphingobacterium zeae]